MKPHEVVEIVLDESMELAQGDLDFTDPFSYVGAFELAITELKMSLIHQGNRSDTKVEHPHYMLKVLAAMSLGACIIAMADDPSPPAKGDEE